MAVVRHARWGALVTGGKRRAQGEKVKVALVGVDPAGRGGMEAVARGLLAPPIGEAFDMHVVVTHRNGLARSARLLLFARALLRLAAWCLGPGPRVVHVHTAKLGSWYRKAVCVALVRLLRRPVLLQLHSGPVDLAASWQKVPPLARPLIRRAFASADRVTSVSQAGAVGLREHLGLHDVLVLPNAAPLVTRVQGERAAEEHRVLYLGGFVNPAKGGSVLLDALPELLRRCPAARVELAGPGVLPEQAQPLVQAGRVSWSGYLDEAGKAEALARAAVVVLPSVSEGWPVWLLEAMSSGVAVVATRTGGIPEIVTDGVDGVLVDVGDPDALASAVALLLDDEPRRRRLGAAGAQRARTLSAERVHAPLAALYTELAADGQRPSPTRRARRRADAEPAPATSGRTTVSVVIPTVGRPELQRALASVRAQTVPPDEVLVVDDTPERSVQVDDAEVVVLRTGGGRGAAGARNLGVERARGDLIAFLDDDDEWRPDHLADAVRLLGARPDVDIYASRALVRYATHERVEPTVLYDGRRTLLDHYYGRTTWARRRRRVMTPTLVFRRPVGDLLMEEGMPSREDLWWLLRAERVGHRLLQNDHVGVVVHQDAGREAARRDVSSEVDWAERLERLQPGAGTPYLVGTTGRLLARTGQQEALEDLVVRIRERGTLPLDLAVVLALLRVYARLRPPAGAGWGPGR